MADPEAKAKMAAMPVSAVMDAGWYGKQETTHTFVKTPADYGMEFEDVAFPALDGVNISAWYIASKNKSLKKLAIVGHQSWSEANRSGCIEHLKGGSLKVEAIDYVKLHKVLHDDGFHVLAYDLRNHGKSEHKMPSGYGEIEFQDAAGVMDFVNQHAELKECKVCLLPFCVSGNSFLKANSLYPDKFKNVVAWATTNIFQMKHMIGTMGLTPEDCDPLFAAKQAEWVEKGTLKADDPNIQFRCERLSAVKWAPDVKVPVLFCDPVNDFIDQHKVSAPEISAAFGNCKFHCIGTDQPAPFNTKGDNRSEGYNFYQSDAGSKVMLEFFSKAMSYTVYYHTAGAGFHGRGLCIRALLEQAGATYTMELPDKYEGSPTFAPPFIKTPAGATISQSTAIMATLGEELGFTPKDTAAEAKALQLSCDAADLLTDCFKFKDDAERQKKWMDYMEKVLSEGPPLSYASFQLWQTFNTMVNYCKLELTGESDKFFKMMNEQPGCKKVCGMGIPFMPS